MATYTDINTIGRDFWPGADMPPNYLARAALFAYNYINARLSARYPSSVPFSAPYPAIIVDISDNLTRLLVEYFRRTGGGKRTVRASDIDELKNPLSPFNQLQALLDGDMDLPGLVPDSPVVAVHADEPEIFGIDDELAHGPSDLALDRQEAEREL